MRLQLKSTNLEITPTIKAYINEKIGSLGKLLEKLELEGGVLTRIEVGRTSMHHNKGEVYRAEVNLDLPQKMIRAEYESDDLYAAVDAVKDMLRKEIIKYKALHNNK